MASEPLREHQFVETTVSTDRLGEIMADIMEEMIHEPFFVREVARRFKIPINIASYVLKRLREEHERVQVMEVPMNQSEGSIAWQSYALHYVEGKTPQSLIDEKMDNLVTLGVVGYESAFKLETALENACVARFGKAYITVSDFNSKLNDVVVPAVECGFEVTTRTSNPVDSIYLRKKRLRLTRDFGEDYRLVVMAPRFRRDVESKYLGLRKDKRTHVYHLPTNGFFPLFYGYWQYRRLFRDVGRPVYMTTMMEMEEYMDSVIVRYID